MTRGRALRLFICCTIGVYLLFAWQAENPAAAAAQLLIAAANVANLRYLAWDIP